MSSVHHNTSRRYQSAAEWPAWTDEFRITIHDDPQPSPEDRVWVAENMNGDDHHTIDPTPIEFLDDRDSAMRDAEDFADFVEAQALELAAEEAEAMDRLERGHHSI